MKDSFLALKLFRQINSAFLSVHVTKTKGFFPEPNIAFIIHTSIYIAQLFEHSQLLRDTASKHFRDYVYGISLTEQTPQMRKANEIIDSGKFEEGVEIRFPNPSINAHIISISKKAGILRDSVPDARAINEIFQLAIEAFIRMPQSYVDPEIKMPTYKSTKGGFLGEMKKPMPTDTAQPVTYIEFMANCNSYIKQAKRALE